MNEATTTGGAVMSSSIIFIDRLARADSSRDIRENANDDGKDTPTHMLLLDVLRVPDLHFL